MLSSMTLDSIDAIRVRGLRKAYGERAALDGVDLTVARGEVLALLGPNGAGKTTLVEILEGHRRADAGSVSVLGFDPARRERAFRARIGIVLQETGLDPTITVREAVELYSAAYPHPRPADEVLALVGLRRPRERAREDALRRPAPPARPRARHRRRPRADLPRRADDRLRSRRAAPVVGADRAACASSARRSCSPRTTWTRRSSSPTASSCSRTAACSPTHTPDALGREDAASSPSALPGYHGLPLPGGAIVERGVARFRSAAPTRDLAPLLAWAAARGMELERLSVDPPDPRRRLPGADRMTLPRPAPNAGSSPACA